MSSRRGFTWIELLVVIGVLGITIALLLPTLQMWRVKEDRTRCMNNLRQIGLATQASEKTHRAFPPLSSSGDNSSLAKLKGPYQTTDTGYTIFAWLLPFLKEDGVYNQLAAVGGSTVKIQKMVVKQYLCPADPSSPHATNANPGYGNGFAVGNYVANYLVFGDPMHRSPVGRANYATMIDGTSNTVIYGEAYGTCGKGGSLWLSAGGTDFANADYVPMMCSYGQTTGTAPADVTGRIDRKSPLSTYSAVAGQVTVCATFQANPSIGDCDFGRTQSAHPGGMYVALGDASVRLVSKDMSQTAWDAVCDPRDGNPYQGGDW